MGMTATRVSLCEDLRRLGVELGDILFIHSSFNSLGPVDGGAGAVVQALQDAVGPAGLILMPSFQLLPGAQQLRAAKWNLASTPSTVGWLTEYFRRMPGTMRSDHYSHSVAARGRHAADFVAGHLRQTGFPSPWDHLPWGKTYGFYSPMYRAYAAAGKLLMLGVDYQTSTYVHLVETLYWQCCRGRDPQASWRSLQRLQLGAWWNESGDLTRDRLAQADCCLFNIRTYVDALLNEVDRNPDPYL